MYQYPSLASDKGIMVMSDVNIKRNQVKDIWEHYTIFTTFLEIQIITKFMVYFKKYSGTSLVIQ